MESKIILVTLAFMPCIFCHPTPEDIKIPDVHVSSPAEINNLDRDPKNANELRDVPPLPILRSAESLEETIQEVEDLIKANPKLPRLTRGEIIDILENITRVNITEAPRTRGDGQRAIMVVMPYTAGSAQGDIKELYTRAPVTRIEGDQTKTASAPTKKSVRRKPPYHVMYVENDQLNLVADPYTSKPPEKVMYSTTTQSTTRPTIQTVEHTSELVTIPSSKSTTFHVHIPAVTTPKPIPQSRPTRQHIKRPVFTTVKPQYRPKPTKKFQELTTKHPNHRYPGDEITTKPHNGIRIIAPPILASPNGDYSAPFTINLKEQNQIKAVTYQPKQTTQKTILDDMAIPDDFKTVVKDLDVLIEPNGHENVQRPAEVHIPKRQPTKQKIEDLLASMGIYASSTTTTIKPIPDISNVADTLTPDMKDLLINFGLLENPNKKPEVVLQDSNIYVQNAQIKPESYVSFKPLPENGPLGDDMDDFLAKFGLGKSSRSQKAISMDKPKKEMGKGEQINLDAVPDSLKSVVQNLGFITRNVNEIPSSNEITDIPKHVFNPTNQKTTEEELDKLSKLLDMIKDLEKLNGNVTEDNIKNFDVKTLKNLIGSLNNGTFVPLDEQDAPNPVHFDYEVVKNDQKRQENETTSETTTPESIITTLSDDEPRNPALVDLEASFGGAIDTVVSTTETVPTTKKSGFYFLFDWNSFLEMDDQKGKRVNLRFQPHVGDPRNFLSVYVP